MTQENLKTTDEEENQEITDEFDEVLDWMVDVFSDTSSPSSEPTKNDNFPTVDLTQIEVGLTGNHLDYVTDGTNWVWFD